MQPIWPFAVISIAYGFAILYIYYKRNIKPGKKNK